MSSFPDQKYNLSCLDGKVECFKGYIKDSSFLLAFFFVLKQKNQWKKIFMYRVTDIPSAHFFPLFFFFITLRSSFIYMCLNGWWITTRKKGKESVFLHKKWHKDFPFYLYLTLSLQKWKLYLWPNSQKVVKIYRLVPWITLSVDPCSGYGYI